MENKCETNRSGFAVVEGLLILLVVAILGFTGWFVWHSQQVANKNNAQAISDSQPTKPTAEPISTYDECVKATGSKIQETYPQICVAKDGKQFTQPTSQATVALKGLDLKYSGLKLSYIISAWKLENANSTVNQCGKTDTATLAYQKNPDFILSFQLGVCGKGGGACFDNANSGCIAQSKNLATITLSNDERAYVVAHRTTTDNGKTWTYNVWLSDSSNCVAGLCGINIPTLSSNPGLITGFYGNPGSWPGNPKSLSEFATYPEVQAMAALLKTAHY